MVYRQDIQILRGVAVLFVVLFHLNIGIFRSGFLGVDVFFVISGFLMAQLYVEGQAIDFFTRRALRLLPAYFVTVLATLLASMLIVLPVEYDQVVTQTLFATAFSSNIGFWLQNSYFSKAEFNPLLHLWSLGVEIQFYLLVPPLLIIARRVWLFLPLCLVLSLLACMAITTISPKTSFFMVPFRVWQFLIGSMIAMHLPTRIRARAERDGSALGALSLAGIVIILFLPIDGEATNMIIGHPGFGAVLVCLATGGVLAFGLPPLFEECLPGRALGKIGNWSYSIYLAHFPIVVLFYYRPFSGTQMGTGNATETVILVILIAALSGLLYQGIEKRNRSLFTPRRAALVATGIVAVAIASGPILLKAYPEDERRIFAARTDRDVYRCGKVFRILHPIDDFCEITKAGGIKPNLMLVGDSHADSIKLSFAAAADARGYRVFFPVPNDPLLNPHFNADWLTREAIARRVETVFFHFYSPTVLAGITEQIRQKLEAAGIRTVLLMPVPSYAVHVPTALYQHQTTGEALPETTLAAYHKQNAQLFSYVGTIHSAMFSWYDLAPALCDPICHLADKDGYPFYFDQHHLSLTGARQLEEIFSVAVGANRISDISKK